MVILVMQAQGVPFALFWICKTILLLVQIIQQALGLALLI